ncbi:zinc finger domain-containing protein [Streptomyces sp. NPDC002540]
MKTTRYGATAPMPDSLRHFMRAGHHPARSLPCPWCHARAHQPCTVRSNGRQPAQVHQQRIANWARTVACCPACQVEPTVPCHNNGRVLEGGAVHHQRYTEADRGAA